MPSSPLDSTHDRMTSGVVCHHRLWAAHTVERCRAWHAIITFGLADTIGRRRVWHAIIAVGQQTRSSDIGRGIPSSLLCSTGGRMASGMTCNYRLWAAHSRTTSGVACDHRLWEAHTVERRRAWHAIIDFGQHKRSNDVWRGMSSSSLGSTHVRTTSGVACHHRLWTR